MIVVIVVVVIALLYFIFGGRSEEPTTVIVEEAHDDGDSAEVGAIPGLVAHFAQNAARGASLTIYELAEDELPLMILKQTKDGVRLDLLVNDGDAEFADAVEGLMGEWEYEEAEGEMQTDDGDYLTYYIDDTPKDLGDLCFEMLNEVYKYDPREEVGLEPVNYRLP
jgi:hypothetical protein